MCASWYPPFLLLSANRGRFARSFPLVPYGNKDLSWVQKAFLEAFFPGSMEKAMAFVPCSFPSYSFLGLILIFVVFFFSLSPLFIRMERVQTPLVRVKLSARFLLVCPPRWFRFLPFSFPSFRPVGCPPHLPRFSPPCHSDKKRRKSKPLIFG